MSNTIEFKLPWQKAYAEWLKEGKRDVDMDSMFRDGYHYGCAAKEEQVIERLSLFVRGKKVDPA